MAQVRAPMPPSKRAKQFSMFDALKGLKEALAAKEHIPEERKTLAEDAVEELNCVLTKLESGTIITVVYYCTHGQCYNQVTGPITKIDFFWRNLQLGQVCIDFEDIYKVIIQSVTHSNDTSN